MKHVHKYERRRLGSWKKSGHEIYKCAVAGCTHYMIDMEAVVGRYSQCWGLLPDYGHITKIADKEFHDTKSCPNEVEMTRYLVFNERRKHPLCDECKQRRKEQREKRIEIQDQKIDRLLELLGENDATIDT